MNYKYQVTVGYNLDLEKKILQISHICEFRQWFKINRLYQREEGLWSKEDKQHLIDTILRNYDVPKIYLRRLGEKEYEIVDGQQRIETFCEFRSKDGFKLDGKISGKKYNGLRYYDLCEDDMRKIDEYELDCVILSNAIDDDIRSIFRKLQRGKPLIWQEKLNAYPGSIVEVTRDIANHPFFNKVTFSLNRYKSLGTSARFLLLEKNGPTDVSPYYIKDFFRINENLKFSNRLTVKVKKVLNYLDSTFSKKVPELNKESWLINLYLLTSHLLENYDMSSKKQDLRDFYIKFWDSMESVRRSGKGLPEVIKFIDANTSGTTSKANIQTRNDFIIDAFLSKNEDLSLLDQKRSFDDYEKCVIWRRDNGICQYPHCGLSVSWSDFHADHIYPWSKGGPTTIKNGQVLCRKHNLEKGSKIIQ